MCYLSQGAIVRVKVKLLAVVLEPNSVKKSITPLWDPVVFILQ